MQHPCRPCLHVSTMSMLRMSSCAGSGGNGGAAATNRPSSSFQGNGGGGGGGGLGTSANSTYNGGCAHTTWARVYSEKAPAVHMRARWQAVWPSDLSVFLGNAALAATLWTSSTRRMSTTVRMEGLAVSTETQIAEHLQSCCKPA